VKKRYTLDRRLLRLVELASRKRGGKFRYSRASPSGRKTKGGRREEGRERGGERERERVCVALLLLFLLYSYLSCIILEFLLIVTRCIGNCKSTPWIMFLPRDRGESAVRFDSDGNSRTKAAGDGRKTSRLDYLDGDGSDEVIDRML